MPMEAKVSEAKQLLTVEEAASFLCVSKSWIFKLTSARSIPHIKLGARTVFDRDELLSWARARTVRAIRT